MEKKRHSAQVARVLVSLVYHNWSDERLRRRERDEVPSYAHVGVDREEKSEANHSVCPSQTYMVMVISAVMWREQ